MNIEQINESLTTAQKVTQLANLSAGANARACVPLAITVCKNDGIKYTHTIEPSELKWINCPPHHTRHDERYVYTHQARVYQDVLTFEDGSQARYDQVKTVPGSVLQYRTPIIDVRAGATPPYRIAGDRELITST